MQSSRTTSVRSRWVSLAVVVLLAFLTIPVASMHSGSRCLIAQENPEVIDPYKSLWGQLANLLAEREYGSAASLIEESRNESDFKPYLEQLKADLKDVRELQRLTKVVESEAAKLKPGDNIPGSPVTAKFVKLVTDVDGPKILYEAANSTKPVEKALYELDYRIWLTLLETGLSKSSEDRYLLGMFLASVERGDRKGARQLLNLAATEGVVIKHWIDRLDTEAKTAEEQKLAKKAKRDDAILGTWRMVIGKGKKERRDVVTFKENGKTDIPRMTWRKRAEGHYVVTLPKGATAHLHLKDSDDKLAGSLVDGAPVHALRVATQKKK